MRIKALLVMAIFLAILPAIPAIAGDAENLIIPQGNKIYDDLAAFADAGYITSTAADYFRANAITKYEAAMYINEASSGQGLSDDKAAAQKVAAYRKEYAGFAKETAYVKPAATPAPDAFDRATERIDGIEQEMAKNNFADSTVFKIEGNLMAKWDDYDMFGSTNQHYGAYDGTRMELDVSGTPIQGFNYSIIMNFEAPTNDPAYGTQRVLFFDSTRLVDTYLVGLSLFNWNLSTGIFWDDITTFIASQGASLRPTIFERDKYAGDSKTREYFENIFRNYFQSLDDRWSKHPWMGVSVVSPKLFGRGNLKVMAGKAENFHSGENTNYLYEFAARYTHRQDIPLLSGADWSANFYNTSSDRSEMAGLGEVNPYKYIKSCTVAGGDLEATLLKLFKLQAEFEWSHNNSVFAGTSSNIPYTMQGSAFYAYLVPTFLIKQFSLELKYTRIDPDYTAPASGVTDTTYKTQSGNGVKLHSVTTLSDPTTDYNNMNKIEASARIILPNGLLRINYGASPQLRPSMDTFYTKHVVIGSDVWWKGFYSGYGFPTDTDPQRSDLLDYNKNRYGLSNWDESGNYIISAGTGGLTTDIWNGHREFVSTGTDAETIKTVNTGVFDLRYEANRLPVISALVKRTLFVHVYGELTNLSAGTNFLVSFDNTRIFTQGLLTTTLVYNAFDGMNLLGYWGMEKWMSKQVIPVEMDYFENVFGLGADFDIAPRTGLFIRVKNYFHDDRFVPANNFHGWLVNAEIKSFF